MSLLDALVMAAASWNEKTPATIQNCYRHAGFVQKNSGELTEREKLPVPQAADGSLSEVSNLFEKFARMTDFSPQISVEDYYINVDETTETSAEMSLADIASSLQQREREEESANEEDVTIPPVTSKMALQALETIQTFLMQQQESENSTNALQLSISLGNCVEKAAHQAKKQSTIDSYFSKKN
ncbi:tigger transposable element-derived protein [Plakobranchus ocellatus]|uniref:Tigger transposable element-derived protein n=1 Tax=Plakobranchus ocellatus TaxID=259542 RepID=A0AAV4A792_9GAST|nr:tigger transposable element-derived protein [Plakobranchus ocellatus]